MPKRSPVPWVPVETACRPRSARRCRRGLEWSPRRASSRLEGAQGDPGLHRDRARPLVDREHSSVPGEVDEDVIGHHQGGERVPAPCRLDVTSPHERVADDRGDLRLGRGPHHALGNAPLVPRPVAPTRSRGGVERVHGPASLGERSDAGVARRGSEPLLFLVVLALAVPLTIPLRSPSSSSSSSPPSPVSSSHVAVAPGAPDVDHRDGGDDRDEHRHRREPRDADLGPRRWLAVVPRSRLRMT